MRIGSASQSFTIVYGFHSSSVLSYVLVHTVDIGVVISLCECIKNSLLYKFIVNSYQYKVVVKCYIKIATTGKNYESKKIITALIKWVVFIPENIHFYHQCKVQIKISEWWK